MSRHPLTISALIVGSLIGGVIYLLSGSALPGYSFFVLIVTIGLTWRDDEVPVFPFIFLLQWIQVASGYVFSLITGFYPESSYPPGDLEAAIRLSLTGLLVLAVAVRLGDSGSGARDTRRMYVENLRGLFWLVMVLYGVNYLSLLSTKSFASLDAILDRVLTLRQIPLLLLWTEVLRQNRNREYLWISLAWVFIPALGSYFSDFKTPLLLLMIVFASFWTPWDREWWRFSMSGAARTVGLLLVTLLLALTWQAGVKRETRRAYDADTVGSNPIERIELFITHATAALPIVFNETEQVVEGLVGRVWYVTFFSRVLDHVPAREPHAEGELLRMAMTNAFYPRFLFPDKPPLPSDSYYTRRFAGINIPDDAGGTSISIGYMAEFYADWGTWGMFASIFAYGLLMGLSARLIRIVVRPQLLTDPALVTALLTVSFFEHQFVKTFAALNVAVIVTIVLLVLTRSAFARFLRITEMSAQSAGDRPAAPPVPQLRMRVTRPAAR